MTADKSAYAPRHKLWVVRVQTQYGRNDGHGSQRVDWRPRKRQICLGTHSWWIVIWKARGEWLNCLQYEWYYRALIRLHLLKWILWLELALARVCIDSSLARILYAWSICTWCQARGWWESQKIKDTKHKVYFLLSAEVVHESHKIKMEEWLNFVSPRLIRM